MSPVFVIGCPRSGTHFLAELFRSTSHCASFHCDDLDTALGDSFLGYAKWYGLSVNTESLVAFRRKLLTDCQSADVYVESNCYLSLFTHELYEAFQARFVFVVREPADVVNSLFVKGWYEHPEFHPPSFDYRALRPNHAFGRLTPSIPEEFERWRQLTRIGRITWFYNALSLKVMSDLRAIPRDRYTVLRVDRCDHGRFSRLLQQLGPMWAIPEEDFRAVASSRPGRASRHRTREDWTKQERAEFEAECALAREALEGFASQAELEMPIHRSPL